jgi:hypothetical protein
MAAVMVTLPQVQRSSATGQAKRPLMRMGRMGPSSRHAQMRAFVVRSSDVPLPQVLEVQCAFLRQR